MELERTAAALGLDRDRLRALEGALQSVYELRHRVKIVEIDETGAASQRSTLNPLEPATDARTQALERRVAFLEARIRDLEAELEEARANVAVEVDMSRVDAAPASDVTLDAETLQRRLTHDPRDIGRPSARSTASRTRRRTSTAEGCVAQALVFLGRRERCRAGGVDGAANRGAHQARASLSPEAWRRFLFHPDEEVITGEIFGSLSPAVLLGACRRAQARQAAPDARPGPQARPGQVDAARGALLLVGGVDPGDARAGALRRSRLRGPRGDGPRRAALRRASARRRSRVARRSSSRSSRAGTSPGIARSASSACSSRRFPTSRISSSPRSSSGTPASRCVPTRSERVSALGAAIEPLLEPLQVDRLRGAFLRFVEDGGRTNLQRWAAAADRTAARTGLLLAGDLKAAAAMLEREDKEAATERIDDLLVFVTSERYASLRREIGVAAEA